MASAELGARRAIGPRVAPRAPHSYTPRVDIALKLLATLGLVALNGFFVAAEFAAVGARASRLQTLADTSLLARLALAIKHKLDLYLSTCQLGITIASLGLGYVTEPAVGDLLRGPLESLGFHSAPGHHHWLAIAIALGISTSLHVVVGEVAPKNFAIFFPDKLLPVLAIPLHAFTILLYPFIWALNAASNLLLRAVGVNLDTASHGAVPHTPDELRTLLAESVSSGHVESDTGLLLTGAFNFGSIKVRQIMTPRTGVDHLLLGEPIQKVLRRVQQSEYTRLPLCDGTLDRVIGLVHMKDLFTHLKLVPGKLRFADPAHPDGEGVAVVGGAPGSMLHVIGSGDIDLRRIKRDVLFVPELLPVDKLLRQFQASAVHMAVVVDEYGTTQGIVTLEDVIEQIVGDISDEFDAAPAADFTPDGEGFRVAGTFPLHELKDRLDLSGVDLADSAVDTVGGYLTQELGRWPRAGDAVPLGAYQARVVATSKNRVTQVMLTPETQDTVKADGPGAV